MTHPHHVAPRLLARLAPVRGGRHRDRVGPRDGNGDGSQMVPSEGVNGGGGGAVLCAVLHRRSLAPGGTLEGAQEGHASVIDGTGGLADEQYKPDVLAQRVGVVTVCVSVLGGSRGAPPR